VYCRTLAQANVASLDHTLAKSSTGGRSARRRSKRLAAAAVLVGMASVSFFIGQLAGTRPAQASATHAYTLYLGDKVTIPAINQVCSVSTEGGATDLFSARAQNARHQVTIFRDRILVWTVGNPDKPAWSGRP
jgi:uncharacterized protein YmfQ (DUF2313 family)